MKQDHFKNGNKGQKIFNKKIERICWENERNETNVFQLCCGQRVYVGYVGFVGKNLVLKITLKWLQGCQETNKK